MQLQGYVSVGALKGYFNVTTSYVLRKLFLVLWPWQHKPWSRQQRPAAGGHQQDQGGYSYAFLPPREDVNSPDMYIPVMAIVTYILLDTLLAGLRGAFHPEVMGSTFAYAMFVVVAEIVILKMGTYFLSITSESQLLDLVAYSGYKFVGVIVTLIVSETVNLGQGTGGWIGWSVFLYTYLANAFFLVSVIGVRMRRLTLTGGSCARSSTSCCRIPQGQAQGRTLLGARCATDAHNSCSSMPMSSNCCSCGCSAVRRRHRSSRAHRVDEMWCGLLEGLESQLRSLHQICKIEELGIEHDRQCTHFPRTLTECLGLSIMLYIGTRCTSRVLYISLYLQQG